MTNRQADANAGKRRATMVICAVLLLQATAVVARVDVDGFPFVDYPMYSSIRRENARTDDRTVFAILEDGRRERVTLTDLYVDDFQYAKWASAILRYPIAPHQAGSAISHRLMRAVGIRRPDIDLVRAFVERYERRRGVKVVGLQVEDGMAIVTRNGMQVLTEVSLMRDLPYPSTERALP